MALTIRLTDSEKKEMDKIVKYLNVKAASKAIGLMVKTYLDLKDYLHQAEERSVNWEKRAKESEAELEGIKTMFSKLSGCDKPPY